MRDIQIKDIYIPKGMGNRMKWASEAVVWSEKCGATTCFSERFVVIFFPKAILPKMMETIKGRTMKRIERETMEQVRNYVRTIPDFPEPGIMFRDVTTVIQDAEGLKLAIDSLQSLLADVEFDVCVGAESRGFIFGAPVAYNMGKGFALARKKGKLPCETIEETYDLEYGSATVEMHKDAIKPGQKVVIVDDLIATGGTIEAIAHLVERLGGEVVKIIFLMELAGLNGRERLKAYDVESVISYEGK